MNAHRAILALLPACLLLAAGGVAGCGYQQSGSYDASGTYKWSSLYREDVQTVAVPIFTNRTYYRGIEFRLTDAVIKQLEASTPYRVAPPDRADTILEAEIDAFDVTTMTRDPRTNIPREQQVSPVINFRWRDLRTGKMLVERRKFDQAAGYYPTLGEGQFEGAQQAIERLAVAIVQELQADW